MNQIKYIIISGLILLLAACSVSSETTKLRKNAKTIKESKRKQAAQSYFINGSVEESKGNYPQAIVEYQAALELDPSAGIHYSLAKNYMIVNKNILALKHARNAAKMEPGNKAYDHLLAKIFRNVDLPDSAINVYSRIVKSDSSDHTAYFNLGSLYEKDTPLKALETYRKLLKRIGPEWSVLVKIADLNDRMGNTDETIETMIELLKLNPSSLDLRKILIEAYLKTNRHVEADKLINEAMKLFPTDTGLIHLKANSLARRDLWPEASEYYLQLIDDNSIHLSARLQICTSYLNKALEDSSYRPIAKEMLEKVDADTTYWQVKYFLGGLAVEENDDSTAVGYFKQAAELAAWNNEVWIRLGGMLFDSQRYEEAIEELTKVVNNFPDNFVINLILGLSYTSEEKYAEAIPYLRKSAKLNPSDITVLSALGFCLDREELDDEAIKYLEMALNIEPDNIQVLSNLGLIYENREVYEKSDSYYQRALAVDSTDALVLNNYAYSLAERGEDLEKALDMSKKALADSPESSSYLDTLGWIYFRLGKYKKAEEYILKAYELDTEDETVIDHLGDVYFKLGRLDEAKSFWEKALEIEPENEEIKNKLDKGEL